MWQKVSGFPIMAYLAITGLFRDFKRDERGLSGTVVAILLILIAVLAIVIIWLALKDWLNALWEDIIGKSKELS